MKTNILCSCALGAPYSPAPAKINDAASYPILPSASSFPLHRSPPPLSLSSLHEKRECPQHRAHNYSHRIPECDPNGNSGSPRKMHLLIHESGSGGSGLLTRPERHGIVGRLAGRRPPGRVHRRHFEAVRGEGSQAFHRERGGVVIGEGAADLLRKIARRIQGSLPYTTRWNSSNGPAARLLKCGR